MYEVEQVRNSSRRLAQDMAVQGKPAEEERPQLFTCI